ncbi:hypothetical protein HanXRQr2_Chr10g0458271 [Helianthus annuus]|uniref:Uncharacterized protein n=1 Tax=Helianthus annuus TaxID=4232 RepID=A0A9K3I0V1_HELAN|nr:hypothetical protein HanXRQr2_Chr10g0458271 [Helianthus annuus]
MVTQIRTVIDGSRRKQRTDGQKSSHLAAPLTRGPPPISHCGLQPQPNNY